MSLPIKLDKCPITPACTQRRLYKDLEGNVYRYDKRDGQFHPHTCTARGSQIPTVLFLAEWLNTETQRVRYIGPARLKRSVLIPPNDSRRHKNHDPWELQEIYVATNVVWKKIDK